MDAARLSNLLHDLSQEAKSLDLAERLKRFHQAFAQNVGQPNQQTSNAFIAAKKDLEEVLDTATSNEYPPSCRRMMAGMNCAQFFGTEMAKALAGILTENATTPGQSVEKVAEFNKGALAFYSLAESVHQELKKLGIPYMYTREGEYEIGVMLPSDLFKNSIEGLSKELHTLDRHLKTFGELAGQDTSSPSIRTTASGSFDVFLNALPDVAAAFADAIEKIVVIYLGILQIRELRENAKKRSIPAEIVKQLEEHEKNRITEELERAADEIIKKHKKKIEKKRENELRGHLLQALKYIAKRMDGGAEFEASPPDVEAELPGDADDETKKSHEAREQFHSALRVSGGSARQLPERTKEILALPESEEEGSRK